MYAMKKHIGNSQMKVPDAVPGLGIEPRWIAPPVFETGASTYSAIRAILIRE